MAKKHTNKLSKWEETMISQHNLLGYEYFSKHYKLSEIDLSKPTELENPDLKQQINFIGRLKRDEGATMFFIIEKSEEIMFEFSQNAETFVWFWLCMKM